MSRYQIAARTILACDDPTVSPDALARVAGSKSGIDWSNLQNLADAHIADVRRRRMALEAEAIQRMLDDAGIPAKVAGEPASLSQRVRLLLIEHLRGQQ